MKILMVCLGNICRSPMAEGILRHHVENNSLDWEIDSAGTSDYHIGEAPDRRAISNLRLKSIDISGLRARQFKTQDFDDFDLILAMDASNYNNILRLARNDDDRSKVRLILNYSKPNTNAQVPDPYYGGLEGFEQVYWLLDAACQKVIEEHR